MKSFLYIFLLAALLAVFPAVYAEPLPIARLIATGVPSGAADNIISSRAGTSQTMELKARFAEGGSSRASWDFPISEDLSQCAGIKLRVRAGNLCKARQLNVYIHCGTTWYAAEFAPYRDGRWDEIVIPKTSFMSEGAPGSWQKADKLRIAAWNGEAGTFVLQVLSVEFLQPNAEICILRRFLSNGNTQIADPYARHVGHCLAARGLYPAVIDEADFSTKSLVRYAFLILPNCEKMSQGLQNVIASYIRKGGHVGGFHDMPSLLLEMLQMPNGKFASTASKNVQFTGVKRDNGGGFRQQSPAFINVDTVGRAKVWAYWTDGTGKPTVYPAILITQRGFWMTHVFLNQDPISAFTFFADLLEKYLPNVWRNAVASRNRQVNFIISNAGGGNKSAESMMQQAQTAVKDGKFALAVRLLDGAMDKIFDGNTPKISSKLGEIRGVWSRDWQGSVNHSWGATAKTLHQAGINAVFPFMVSAYDAAYPSNYVHSRGRSDKLRECLVACRENKIKLHIWFQCLNCENAPAEILEKYAKEGRFQRGAGGQMQHWLCPSLTKNRLLLENIVTELVRKYDVDGIQFDMLRFPVANTCFCQICRKSFVSYLKRQVEHWPQDVMPGGPEYANWQLFRSEVISSLLKTLSDAVRRTRGNCQISVAVMPDVRGATKNYGQNWSQWKKSGLVDFICPMDYRMSADMLATDLKQQISAIGGVKGILPGIGLTVNRMSDSEFGRQIQAVRQAGLSGYVIFEYNGKNFPALQ